MTKEIMDKLMVATNVEELMALAKENGAALESAEAQKLFEALQAQKAGELSEEELAKASGGFFLNLVPDCPSCHSCAHVKLKPRNGNRYYCSACDVYIR